MQTEAKTNAVADIPATYGRKPAPVSPRPKLSVRSGSSRKLLARKAAERADDAPAGEGLEDSFPAAAEAAAAAGDAKPDSPVDAATADLLPAPATPRTAAPDGSPMLPSERAETGGSDPTSLPNGSAQTPPEAERPTSPEPAPAWSEENERALQAMLARRKAARVARRGRSTAGQKLRAGDVAPNAGTVVATIVGLVAERGAVGRDELLDLMAGATFASAKARPANREWRQGYVAGAVRGGFLAVAGEQPAAVAEAA